MSQRIWTLTTYLLSRLLISLTGLVYLAGTAAFYLVAFATRTAEADYFMLVLGMFGAAVTFFGTLSLAARANEGHSYPLLVRLHSRVEFLAAVLAGGLLFGLMLQLGVVGVVFARNTPELLVGHLVEIPPIWLSLNIFAAVIALHASDFVASGWSRVGLFGVLAAIIFLGESYTGTAGWLADQLRLLSYSSGRESELARQYAQMLRRAANWLIDTDVAWASDLFERVFWPFQAVITAVLQGAFQTVQVFAPAVLLIYAAVLFLLASGLFAGKDLYLIED